MTNVKRKQQKRNKPKKNKNPYQMNMQIIVNDF